MDVEDNVINENMLVLRDVEHYQLSCLTIYRDDMQDFELNDLSLNYHLSAT